MLSPPISLPAHLPTASVLSHIETIVLWIFICFHSSVKHISNGLSHHLCLSPHLEQPVTNEYRIVVL